MLTPEQITALLLLSPSPNRVKAAMAIAGVTQVQVAQALGITQPAVSDVAIGNYSRLALDTARSFANYFGCSIDVLFPAKEAVA